MSEYLKRRMCMALMGPLMLALVACKAAPEAAADAASDGPGRQAVPGNPPHHTAKGFVNIDGAHLAKPFSAFMSWQLGRIRDGLPPPPSAGSLETLLKPVATDTVRLQRNRSEPLLTWIGHATALVQVEGLNILTDPHFSERASPLPFAGPKRLIPLPLALADLPRIDVVVISHSHYDHLDRASVVALNAQPGGAPLFLVPLGVDGLLRAWGVTSVKAFDWWQAHRVGAVEFSAVPAQHWSARMPWDRNETLWVGWVMKSPHRSVYFAGDTAYSPVFAEIGRRFGPFDLALLPIGAYEPRWFMRAAHVNPAEAVQIHRDVGARRSVGVHWGTFDLSDEAQDQPPADLAEALSAQRLPAEAFGVLRAGQSVAF